MIPFIVESGEGFLLGFDTGGSHLAACREVYTSAQVWGGGGIKQRIQSSRIPPCHRHMVIATNLSSLFDLLHCSIPQTRAECCLEFTAVSGYRMFPGLSGSWAHTGAQVGVVSRSQSAPHMHVLVCICSNVRQFHVIGQSHTQVLCYNRTQAIDMLHASSCDFCPGGGGGVFCSAGGYEAPDTSLSFTPPPAVQGGRGGIIPGCIT